MKVGRITVSDRAAAGLYEDRSGPEIERAVRAMFGERAEIVAAVVPDEPEQISARLIEFADRERCDLVVTTGGTGIAPRDVTPEATRAVLEKELPGFGEIMRVHSFARTPTAVLSRATAGTRGTSLIINLPGKPAAVAECLALLSEAIRETLAILSGDDPHRAPSPASA